MGTSWTGGWPHWRPRATTRLPPVPEQPIPSAVQGASREQAAPGNKAFWYQGRHTPTLTPTHTTRMCARSIHSHLRTLISHTYMHICSLYTPSTLAHMCAHLLYTHPPTCARLFHTPTHMHVCTCSHVCAIYTLTHTHTRSHVCAFTLFTRSHIHTES